MRRILLLSGVLIAASFAVCSAGRPTEIPIREIAIGGIDTLASEEYVRSVYGEPDEITYEPWQRAQPHNQKTFRYGDSFFIVFDADDGRAWRITTTGNNGLATPAGFANGVGHFFGHTALRQDVYIFPAAGRHRSELCEQLVHRLDVQSGSHGEDL